MALIDFSLNDIGSLFTSAREAITGKKILDPKEMAKLELQFQQLEQASRDGQIAINKIEAAHKSLFVAGWRPAIGWICAIAVGYSFVLHPILEWILILSGIPVDTMPKLEAGQLMNLVLAMLGMAGLRTYEKEKGINREK